MTQLLNHLGELRLLEQVLWICAAAFTVMFVIVAIMRFVGLADDHDAEGGGHGDFHGDHDHGHVWGFFQPFTFTNFVTFMTVFSWMSLGGLANGQSEVKAMSIAVGVGLVALLIVAWLFYAMSRATSSGTISLENAIGRSGTAYITIPAHGSGIGQVQVAVHGALHTLRAVSENKAIPAGRPVKVTATRDNLLVVAPA